MGDYKEIGRMLICGFLNNFSKQEILPHLLFFINECTFLAQTEDEAYFAPLHTIAEKGVDITICKTCLDYFKLDYDNMPVGRIGTAPEFVKLTTE